MALYLLGFFAAIFSAFLLKLIIKTQERSYMIMEMPTYRKPKWANVGYTIIEKTKSFVFEAGKIILAISVILWVLASYGPGEKMRQAEQIVMDQTSHLRLSEDELQYALGTGRWEILSHGHDAHEMDTPFSGGSSHFLSQRQFLELKGGLESESG